MSFGVKNRFAHGPVHALEVIYEYCTFNLIDGYRQGKRVGLLARLVSGHTDRQPAGPVVALFSEDQGRAAFGLFASRLAGQSPSQTISPRPWDVAAHHSTASFPRCGPSGISS